MTLVFHQITHPPFIDRLIPDNETSAWDNLGPLEQIGVCRHTMVGYLNSTDRWFRNELGRKAGGLTTYGVGGPWDGPALNGVIYRWNDPLGKAHTVTYDWHEGYVSPNRAGWANGGSDGLEGDGVLFVRNRGVNAINKLISIERSDGGDPYNAPYEGKQFENIARLSAYWADYAEIPWNAYPLNPKVNLVTDLEHFEFATKGCPHSPVISKTDAHQDRVRALLKAAQEHTEGGEVVVPPPTPIVVDHDLWPGGYTEARLAAQFGTLMVHTVDGTVVPAKFNVKGPISNAWAARGALEKRTVDELPPPSVSVDIPSREAGGLTARLVLFDGRGSDNWMLMRPGPDVSFRWVDQTKAA